MQIIESAAVDIISRAAQAAMAETSREIAAEALGVVEPQATTEASPLPEPGDSTSMREAEPGDVASVLEASAGEAAGAEAAAEAQGEESDGEELELALAPLRGADVWGA